MQRKTITTVLCSVAFLCLQPEICSAETYKLHITKKDNTVEEISLSEKPAVTFADGKLCVVSMEFECELADVSTCTFVNTDIPSSIGETAYSVAYDGTDIVLKGETGDVAVYDTAGVKQNVGIRGDGNSIVVETARLGKGIYIIKTEKKSFKITKR